MGDETIKGFTAPWSAIKIESVPNLAADFFCKCSFIQYTEYKQNVHELNMGLATYNFIFFIHIWGRKENETLSLETKDDFSFLISFPEEL